MNKTLETVVEQEVDAIGYDVVLLRQSGTRSRPVLELRIDRRDGTPVSIADCVRVSRTVEARLDAGIGDTAPFGGRRYELQVSSPGDARRRQHAGGDRVVPGAEGSRRPAGSEGEKRDGSALEVGGSARTPEHTDTGSRDGRFD